MITIQAPYPAVETTIYLPSPNFNDTRALASESTIKRAMDGTPYSYINDLGDKALYNFSFILTRMKALEIEAFFKLYGAKQWKLTNFDEQEIIGYCKTNPLRFVAVSHGVTHGSVETYTLDFEFESN